MATIEYDDILLNIGSRLQGKALDNAIKNLESMGNALKDIKSNDFKSATDDIKGFVSAIKPVAKSTVQSYKDLAKAMNTIASKAGKAMKAVGGEKFQRQSMAELEEIARKSGQKSQAGIPDWEMDWYRDTSWSGQVASATSEAQGLKSAIDGIDSSTEDAYNDLKAYLELYPKTKDSYLKNQLGYDPDTIAHVRQDLYMAAEDSKRAAEGVGEINKQAKNALTPMEKLANKFKNFLQYRAMRAIWTGFINGAKEGLKNLENWDRNIGHTGFADSMDRARDSILTLKNALAVITAPALEWISGVLQRIAQWAVAAANAISRFFAILGGKSSYRVIKYAEGVSAAENKIAGSTKKANDEFKKQLMGFDEINNLTAQNDGGSGGGGGGGGGGSVGSMFDTEEVGELGKVEAILSKLGNAWREMAEKIRTTDDATSRHLNTVGKVWQGWKDFFADPKASWSDWVQKWNDGIEAIKNNFSTFHDAFKTARDNGATFFEAIDAGFDAISTSAKDFGKATKDATTDAGKHIKGDVGGSADEAKGKIDQAKESTNKWKTSLQLLTTGSYRPTVSANSIVDAKTATDKLKGSLDDIQGTYKVTIDTTENVTRTVTEVVAKTGGAGSKASYQKYASGGYPTTGQLFIAREAGAELVGNIGGRTAVVNNADIVASVSQGVAQAVASVMGNGSNVTVTLEGDAKGIFKVVQKEGRAYSARTGQPALA